MRFEVSDNEPSEGGEEPEDDGPPMEDLLHELAVVVDCLSNGMAPFSVVSAV